MDWRSGSRALFSDGKKGQIHILPLLILSSFAFPYVLRFPYLDH
jgi:hypothetical protein